MNIMEDLRVNEPWSLKGELTLSCNCEVFCPCVLSLGKSAVSYTHLTLRQECAD